MFPCVTGVAKMLTTSGMCFLLLKTSGWPSHRSRKQISNVSDFHKLNICKSNFQEIKSQDQEGHFDNNSGMACLKEGWTEPIKREWLMKSVITWINVSRHSNKMVFRTGSSAQDFSGELMMMSLTWFLFPNPKYHFFYCHQNHYCDVHPQPSVILKSLSLCIVHISSYGLLGPSGCGKTTLLRCIVGLMKVDSGSLLAMGDVPSAPGHSIPGPMVGYMPQVSATGYLKTPYLCFLLSLLHIVDTLLTSHLILD